MATRGENCNDWPRTVMTGGCLLVAFAPDGATGNDAGVGMVHSEQMSLRWHQFKGATSRRLPRF